MTKYIAHVPLENYGFIAAEIEGEAEDAIAAYRELNRYWKKGDGLSQKDFNKVMDEYLATGKLNGGGQYWEDMNELQRTVINEIKKSFKRTKET